MAVSLRLCAVFLFPHTEAVCAIEEIEVCAAPLPSNPRSNDGAARRSMRWVAGIGLRSKTEELRGFSDLVNSPGGRCLTAEIGRGRRADGAFRMRTV